jgi:hypothetical protein
VVDGPVAYAYALPVVKGRDKPKVFYFKEPNNPGTVDIAIYEASTTSIEDFTACKFPLQLTLEITHDTSSPVKSLRLRDPIKGRDIYPRDEKFTRLSDTNLMYTAKICRESPEALANVDVLGWPNAYYFIPLQTDNPLPYASLRNLAAGDTIKLAVTLDQLWPVIKTPFAAILKYLLGDTWYSTFQEISDDANFSDFSQPASAFQLAPPNALQVGQYASWGYSNYGVAASLPSANGRNNPFKARFSIDIASTTGKAPLVSKAYEGINTIDQMARDQSQNTLLWRYGFLDKATKIGVETDLGQIHLQVNLPTDQNRVERPAMPDNLTRQSQGDWIPTEVSLFQYVRNEIEPAPAGSSQSSIYESFSSWVSINIKPEQILTTYSELDPIIATATPLSEASPLMDYADLPPLSAEATNALGLNPEHLVLQFLDLDNQPIAGVLAWSYDANNKILQQLKSDARGLVDFGSNKNLEGIGYSFFERVRVMDTQTTQGFLQVRQLPREGTCSNFVDINVEISLPETLKWPPSVFAYPNRLKWATGNQFTFDTTKSAYVDTVQVCNDRPIANDEFWVFGSQQNFRTFISARDVVAGDTWRIDIKPRTVKLDVPAPQGDNMYFLIGFPHYTSHFANESNDYVYLASPLILPVPGSYGRSFSKDLKDDTTSQFAAAYGECDIKKTFTSIEQMLPENHAQIHTMDVTPIAKEPIQHYFFWKSGQSTLSWSEINITASDLSVSSEDDKNPKLHISRSRKHVRQLSDGSFVLIPPPTPSISLNLEQRSQDFYIQFSDQGKWPRLYAEQYEHLANEGNIPSGILSGDRRECSLNTYLKRSP